MAVFCCYFLPLRQGVQFLGVMGLLFGVLILAFSSYGLKERSIVVQLHHCKENCLKDLIYLANIISVMQLVDVSILIPSSVMLLSGVNMNHPGLLLPYMFWLVLDVAVLITCFGLGTSFFVNHGSDKRGLTWVIIFTVAIIIFRVHFFDVVRSLRKEIQKQNKRIIMPILPYEIPDNPSLHLVRQKRRYNPGYAGDMCLPPGFARHVYRTPGNPSNATNNPSSNRSNVYHLSGYTDMNRVPAAPAERQIMSPPPPYEP